MKALTTLLFSLLIVAISFAQNEPKDIFELYGISKGCDNTPKEMKSRDMRAAAPPPPPPRTNPKTNFSPESFQAHWDKYAEAISGMKLENNPKIKLDNENILFRKGGLWGLMDKGGNVILEAQFKYVERRKNDFVASNDGIKENYYDGSTGKAQLDNEYYGIRKIGDDEYVINDDSGLGVMRSGKLIIKNEYRRINTTKKGGFLLTDLEGSRFLLLNDLKTKVFYYETQAPQDLGDGYFLTHKDLINHNTGKRLICDSGIGLRLGSKKDKTLFVQRYRENYFFMIDFEGKLITNTPFTKIIGTNKRGFTAVEVRLEESGGKGVGIISPKGEWTFEPTPKVIMTLQEGEFVFINQITRKYGMMDEKGNPILPDIYKRIWWDRNEGKYLLTSKQEGEGDKKEYFSIDSKEFEPIKPESKTRRDEVGSCDKKLYIEYKDGLGYFMNKKGKVLLGDVKHVFDFDDFIKIQVGTGGSRTYNLLNCKLKKIGFKYKGKMIYTFKSLHSAPEGGFIVGFAEGSALYNSAFEEVEDLREEWGISGLPYKKVQYVRKKGDFIETKDGQLLLEGSDGFSLQGYNADLEMFNITFSDKKKALVTLDGELFLGKFFYKINYLGKGLIALKETKYGKTIIVDSSGKRIIQGSFPFVYKSDGLLEAGKSGYYNYKGEKVR